ncbi:MAG: hypothetical protein FWE76_06980 [Symbiobacteriaceae bacterium]|nr:hypothetical protein [Symbiobacteriaceae bacterium]
MVSIYFIPRNFSDNGRVLGLFEGRHVIQAGIWGVPFSILVAIIPWLPLQVKAIIWGAVAGFPCLIILSGMLDLLTCRIRFSREAKIYHSVREMRQHG